MSTSVRCHRSGSGGLLVGIGKFSKGFSSWWFRQGASGLCQACIGSGIKKILSATVVRPFATFCVKPLRFACGAGTALSQMLDVHMHQLDCWCFVDPHVVEIVASRLEIVGLFEVWTATTVFRGSRLATPGHNVVTGATVRHHHHTPRKARHCKSRYCSNINTHPLICEIFCSRILPDVQTDII